MKDFMQNSLKEMCQQLTAVVDDRFCAMKRELSVEYSEAVAAKKARTDKYQFESKGNEQQYEHQVAVLGAIEGATAALHNQDIAKAKAMIQEGKDAIEVRIKLIKIADKSEHGWQTVAEYVTNELADDSDDEKRLDRAERTAEKKAKKKVRTSQATKARQNFTYSKPLNQSSPRPLLSLPVRNMNTASQVGPCYKLSTRVY